MEEVVEVAEEVTEEAAEEEEEVGDFCLLTYYYK